VVPWVLCENDRAVRARWQSTWSAVESIAGRADKTPLLSNRFTHTRSEALLHAKIEPYRKIEVLGRSELRQSGSSMSQVEEV
jgi:hypothetical protein